MHQNLEIEGFQVELHLSRLNLGQIQHVVNQTQQMAGGAEDLPQIVGDSAVAVIAGVLDEHLTVTDDGVHRRAEFVAHFREKRTLRLIGLLGGDHGALQFRRARGDLLFQLLVDLAQALPGFLGVPAGHFQFGVSLLNRLDHEIKRTGEGPDLVPSALLHPHAVVLLLRNPAGRASQFGEGSGQTALEGVTDHHREQARGQKDDDHSADEVAKPL